MLIALIAIVHSAFGWLYATSLSPQTTRQPLSASGEAYLQSAPGWNTDSEQDAAGFNRTALSILERGLPYPGFPEFAPQVNVIDVQWSRINQACGRC